MSTTGFKTLNGSFSRYSNEMLKDFFVRNMFVKICGNMKFPSINYVMTGFKTLSGSFSMYWNEILKVLFQIFFWSKYVEK